MPFFEPVEKVEPKHVDLERARKSLREELEAIDYYQERIDATGDTSLKRLLEHNMDEEKEHAAMLIGWLRKNDPAQDSMFQEYDYDYSELLSAGKHVDDYLSGEW